MTRFIIGKLPIALLAVSLLLGCNDHSASVVGTVTLEGQQLPTGANGGLTFLPVSGGPLATGTLSSNGTYTLSTGSQHSLQPGHYRVTITVLGPALPTDGISRPMPGKLLSAERYRDKSRTELEVDVKSGRNHFDFDVKRNSASATNRLPQLVSISARQS